MGCTSSSANAVVPVRGGAPSSAPTSPPRPRPGGGAARPQADSDASYDGAAVALEEGGLLPIPLVSEPPRNATRPSTTVLDPAAAAAVAAVAASPAAGVGLSAAPAVPPVATAAGGATATTATGGAAAGGRASTSPPAAAAAAAAPVHSGDTVDALAAAVAAATEEADAAFVEPGGDGGGGGGGGGSGAVTAASLPAAARRLGEGAARCVRRALLHGRPAWLRALLPVYDARLLLATTTLPPFDGGQRGGAALMSMDATAATASLTDRAHALAALTAYLSVRNLALGGLQLPPAADSGARELDDMRTALSARILATVRARLTAFADGVTPPATLRGSLRGVAAGVTIATDWLALVCELTGVVHGAAGDDALLAQVCREVCGVVMRVVGDTVAASMVPGVPPRNLAEFHAALVATANTHWQRLCADTWAPLAARLRASIREAAATGANVAVREGLAGDVRDGSSRVGEQLAACLTAMTRGIGRAMWPLPARAGGDGDDAWASRLVTIEVAQGGHWLASLPPPAVMRVWLVALSRACLDATSRLLAPSRGSAKAFTAAAGGLMDLRRVFAGVLDPPAAGEAALTWARNVFEAATCEARDLEAIMDRNLAMAAGAPLAAPAAVLQRALRVRLDASAATTKAQVRRLTAWSAAGGAGGGGVGGVAADDLETLLDMRGTDLADCFMFDLAGNDTAAINAWWQSRATALLYAYAASAMQLL